MRGRPTGLAGGLSQERRKRLDDLGFVWDARRNKPGEG